MLESHAGVIAHYSSKGKALFYLHKIKIHMLLYLEILSGRKNKTLLTVLTLGSGIMCWHSGGGGSRILLFSCTFRSFKSLTMSLRAQNHPS